jgi:YHS domain-containing protein
MNKITLALLLLVGTVLLNAPVYAVDEAAPAAVNVGNKVCPVSGEPIDPSSGMEAVTVEHNGKIYNLCCAGCEDKFKSDPEKYSKIAEDEAVQKTGSGS